LLAGLKSRICWDHGSRTSSSIKWQPFLTCADIGDSFPSSYTSFLCWFFGDWIGLAKMKRCRKRSLVKLITLY
jgi:hypothetical protein